VENEQCQQRARDAAPDVDQARIIVWSCADLE
jgi:hypothetical protein